MSETHRCCTRNNNSNIFELLIHNLPPAVFLGFVPLFYQYELLVLILFSYARQRLLSESIFVRVAAIKVDVLLGLFVFRVFTNLLDVFSLVNLQLLAVTLFLDVQNFLVFSTLRPISMSGSFAACYLEGFGDV